MVPVISKKLLKKATPIINDIAHGNSLNGSFAYFEWDDIAQEVWVICIQALENYKPSKGSIEHFLRRCVANRLRNLKRDRYFSPFLTDDKHIKDRINIVNALPMGDGPLSKMVKFICAPSWCEPLATIECNDFKQRIEKLLPEDTVDSFHKLLDGYQIPKNHLIEIRRIATILLKRDQQ